MTSLEASLKKALDGQRLIRVRTEIYVGTDGKFALRPSRIALGWSDFTFSVECASDGESLQASQRPLEAVDMQEAGRIDIIDQSSDPAFASLVGSNLIAASIVEEFGFEIGARLKFATGSLDLLNNGDELWVEDEIAPDIMAQFTEREVKA